mmetsp:Transcript_32102/g.67304  ORF Transcript_32102/g.67304 Transcript_32102/m.67304 type:complete len:103 (+) Transcript_32102:17-325(+)
MPLYVAMCYARDCSIGRSHHTFSKSSNYRSCWNQISFFPSMDVTESIRNMRHMQCQNWSFIWDICNGRSIYHQRRQIALNKLERFLCDTNVVCSSLVMQRLR